MFGVPDQPAVTAADPLFVEAFQTLRTNLLMRLSDGMKTLMITGARPREGKSTIAAHLACTLARGASVLLVDADLRRPSLHTLMQVSNEVGLSDLLAGSADVDQALRQIHPSLAFLPAGRTPSDPHLLLQQRFAPALDLLQRRVDLVIVDSPPVLAVADATLIGPRVDGVLLVMKWGGVREAEAVRARTRLESAGARLLGCVLTQLRSDDPSYHPYVKDYAARPVGVLEPSKHPA